jgi:acyl carrier protein
MNTNTLEFLIGAIKANTNIENEITGAHSLRDDLGLDSLGILALADQVEEEFDIALEAEDLADNPATVEAFVKLIDKKRGL